MFKTGSLRAMNDFSPQILMKILFQIYFKTMIFNFYT